MAKSLHPEPPKPPKKTRLMRLSAILVVAILTVLLMAQLDNVEPWWVRWGLYILAGTGAGLFARWVEPKPQPAWVEGPKDVPVTYSTYWPGDVQATPEAIRAAMLTTLRNEFASAGVRRPDGRITIANNRPEGWRIECWDKDGANNALALRADGQKLLDAPKGLNKWLQEKGDVFTFEEAFAVLCEFADGVPKSQIVEWQLRSDL